MRIVLGIGGGIAAYKSAALLRLLSEAGHHVVPMPTRAALEFVGAPTWEALSGEPVTTDVFDRVEDVNHVMQGQRADLVIVAPATADLLAKAAHGHADDLLTTTLLATEAPVLLAPAMHTQMWQNPSVQDNVLALRRQGRHVLEPASGRLTGADTGPGRLPDPEAIRDAALALVDGGAPDASTGPAAQEPPGAAPLRGLSAVVSAGGTQEPLDPVRFLGNRSSGKQGIAVARALRAAGAEVELVAGHVEAPLPDQAEGIGVSRIGTALELQEVMEAAAGQADVVVMTAAVADFRPAEVAEAKIKKTDDEQDAPTIVLTRNPDILRGLVQHREELGRSQLIVGFAAETGDGRTDPLEFGRAKLERKGCDLLCVNQVGTDLVFGQDTTRVTILEAPGAEGEVEDEIVEGAKDDVAAALVRRIARRLGRGA